MKLIPSRKSPEERAGTMSVVDHLTELRHRIIICLWAVGGAAIVAWFLYEPFKDIIRKPYCAFVAQNPQLAGPSGCELVFTSPIESETRGEIRFGFPGVFEGREVFLQVLAYAPEDEEPGLKLDATRRRRRSE